MHLADALLLGRSVNANASEWVVPRGMHWRDHRSRGDRAVVAGEVECFSLRLGLGFNRGHLGIHRHGLGLRIGRELVGIVRLSGMSWGSRRRLRTRVASGNAGTIAGLMASEQTAEQARAAAGAGVALGAWVALVAVMTQAREGIAEQATATMEVSTQATQQARSCAGVFATATAVRTHMGRCRNRNRSRRTAAVAARTSRDNWRVGQQQRAKHNESCIQNDFLQEDHEFG